ncbi:MAG: GAF domain-containing sensor histidine kinase [Anaerolineae bacterium]|nr:GAF domain-containing sensor histidine kinase [Anaerolineae bacterium]
MKNELPSTPRQWQDWAIFGMRGVLLVTVILAVYMLRSRANPAFAFDIFVLPALVVTAASLLLLAMMFIPAARPLIPVMITAGDWAIAASFAYLIGEEPLLLLLVAFTLAAAGLLRQGWTWGALHAAGVFAAVGIMLAVNIPGFNNRLENFFPVVLVALGGTAVIAVWVYLRDEHTHGQTKHLDAITRQKENELTDMRERTRAISDMATLLNGTLNYEKILDAALDIGRLSIRKDARYRLASMVLLFRAQDDSLYIANARGLSHNDMHRIVPGKSGIVGKTLEKSIPIIGKELSKDPELNGFVSMQGMRASLCIPLRAGYDNYGVVLYASDAVASFDEDRIEALMAISTQATIALQNAVLNRNLMEEKERIIEMEENARKALVRDLHDVPTQTIAAVAMRIRIIQKLLERGSDEVPAELKTVEEMSLRASEELRHVLFKLRPLALESQGLTAALNQLAEKLIKTYKQNVAVRVSPDIENLLDHNALGVIFYLIEEAVNNARKYAEAALITVQVGHRSGVVIVRIADNGKGFDMEKVVGNDKSYGMTNMRERAELLDGTLKLESAPGIGTTITVTIPIPERSVRNVNQPRGEALAPQQSKLAQVAVARMNGQG